MKQNSKVKIYDSENICISKGIIYDVINPLDVVIENVDSYKFSNGQKVFLHIFDDEYGIELYSGIVKNNTVDKLEVIETCFVEKRQCRAHTRIEIYIMGNASGHLLPNHDLINYEVDISNISAGGIFFVGSDEIKNLSDLVIKFKVGANPISLSLEVVRIETLENNMLGYGCKIINAPRNLEPILNTFS